MNSGRVAAVNVNAAGHNNPVSVSFSNDFLASAFMYPKVISNLSSGSHRISSMIPIKSSVTTTTKTTASATSTKSTLLLVLKVDPVAKPGYPRLETSATFDGGYRSAAQEYAPFGFGAQKRLADMHW